MSKSLIPHSIFDHVRQVEFVVLAYRPISAQEAHTAIGSYLSQPEATPVPSRTRIEIFAAHGAADATSGAPR